MAKKKTENKTNIKGVSQNTYTNATKQFETKDETNKAKTTADTMSNNYYSAVNTPFTPSADVKNKETEKQGYFNNYKELASQENIIDKDTMNTINSTWTGPSEAVTQADSWLTSQREKLQSGKTSWTDKYGAAIDEYLNRDKFEYDVDNDPLFQQALASAMNSGKSAMQDTIGQASALTGGYGSTYATSAGNQAYNAFIEDAYNNLPEYYQMALSAYEAEGQEMYNRVAMLGEADATEWGKNVDAYNVTSDWRNQAYNEEYSLYRDNKSDAFSSANLQLNEYGMRVDNAYNLYNAANDDYQFSYNAEYGQYQDNITNLYNGAVMANDRWSQMYANDFNEWNASIEQWTSVMNMENQDYWNQASYDQTEKWNQKDLDYKNAQLSEQKRQYNLSRGDTNNDGVLSNDEKKALQESTGGYTYEEMEKASQSQATQTFNASLLTPAEFNRRGASRTKDGKKIRFDNYNEYVYAVLDDWYKDGKLTKNEAAYLKGAYGLTDDDER